ncbi:MAG: hypothetical protein ABI821_15085 [Pseudomonadota bacterium]
MNTFHGNAERQRYCHAAHATDRFPDLATTAHPETSVAESCGAGHKVYKGADEPRTEYLAVPDLGIFALAGMLPADSPMKISAGGKSIVLSAKNNRWIWTLTPSVK